MEIARGIRRIGTGLINSYLLDEAGEVTIIDAGAPSYWHDLTGELAAMGRTLADVRALVLTHGHSDHIGFAERLRRERAVPVSVHQLDAALARGEIPNPAKTSGGFRLGPTLRFVFFSLTHGMVRTIPITEVSTFGDGATLDMPGAPRVVHLPGHTEGSAALHIPARDALFIGDAFVTVNVLTGASGPQIGPFNADAARAYESLARLDGLEASLVLPGHGEPWRGGVGEALRRIRVATLRT